MLLALSSKMMVFAACLLDTVLHSFVMLLSQEYTYFSTNTASRLLMVCMVAVDNTAEIIQTFLTTVCTPAWTVHNGINVANAAINLGSGTTLHLT